MTAMLPDQPELDPAALASTDFSKARRGLEPAEVRAALGRAADALRAWQLRDKHLEERISDLEARLAEAEKLDEGRMTAVLGEETTRIVAAAREAATEIRTKAEEKAERLLRETDEAATASAEALRSEAQALHDEATRVRSDAQEQARTLREEAAAAAAELRSSAESDAAELRSSAESDVATMREDAAALATSTVSEAQARSDELLGAAETVLAERTAEAEAAAAEIAEGVRVQQAEAAEAVAAARAEAESEAAQIRETAAAEAEQLRSESRAEAERVVEAARARGREMVEEAKAVRERMLGDLADRRRTARRQIEAAVAGRDRIVELLNEAHSAVAGTIGDLGQAQSDAAVVADAAANAVDHAADNEFEAELAELRRDEPLEELTPTGFAPDIAPAAEVTEAHEADDEPADAAAESEADDDVDDAAGTGQLAEVIDVAAADAAEEDSSGEADTVAEPDDATATEADAEHEGATVHDLFERLRAESTDDDSFDDAPDTDGDQTADVAEIVDLTDTPAAAAAVSAAVESSSADESASQDAATSGEVTAVAVIEDELSGDDAVLDLRDERLVPVEKSLARVLKRLASDEQNEVLDRLRRVKRGRPEPEAILPDRSSQNYVDALADEFAAAVDSGRAVWAQLSGADPADGTNPSEATVELDPAGLEQLSAQVDAFVEMHHAHLERTFVEAEEAGLDAADIGDRVRAAYRDWRSASLAGFAGDLATAGFTYGQMSAAGTGTPWRWVVDNGGLGCADGEDNALAGAVECASPFPTGDITPPAHPGCRCILAPAE